MNKNLETLATALYVKIDDLLIDRPELRPERPAIGFQPQLSDAELLTLAVMSMLLQFTSERRWVRYMTTNLTGMFPYLPRQPAYNKRLRKAALLMMRVIRILAADTSLWSDDVWVVDSTPVECGRSRPTALRSDLAGWAEYGYCASHSRYFWGLRLHVVATLHGLPVMFALAGAKDDERVVLTGMLDHDRDLVDARLGQTLIGDKNYFGKDFEADVAQRGMRLLRPRRKGEPSRGVENVFRPLRQNVESIFNTMKAQLNLELHHAYTPLGVIVRVLAKILALTAAIWHNDSTGQPIMRSLIAYDH